MPPVSEAQRWAMRAAASGHSNIGIPKSVGKEFSEADPGGKLPEKAKDMERSDWRGLLKGIIKFFMEEEREPEHTEPEALDGYKEEVQTTKAQVDFEHPAKGANHCADCVHFRDPARCAKVAGTVMPEDWCKLFEKAQAADHSLGTAEDDKEFEHILNAVKGKADDPGALAAWIRRRVGPWKGHDSEEGEDYGTSEGARKAAQTRKSGGSGYDPVAAHKEMAEYHERASNTHAARGAKSAANTHFQIAHMHQKAHQALTSGHPQAQEYSRQAWAYNPNFDEASDERDHFAAAYDRSSARSFDSDGRLHVDTSNISKATVNPYYGHEIPDYEKLGLDPNKKYKLLRHPDELKKAADTFNNMPILSRHVPVNAEDHHPGLVIGATGSDAEFDHPYLRNSLVFWAKPAIDDVESGQKRQLSCAYRYSADMTPGVYEGQPYDGIMRDLKGNHLALVAEGRAGPDVVVADQQIRESPIAAYDSMEPLMFAVKLSPKAATAKGALAEYLKPKLAMDARLPDLNPMLEGVTAKNFRARRPLIASTVKQLMSGRLAQDEDLDDLADLLEQVEEMKDPDRPDEEEEGKDALHANAGFPMGMRYHKRGLDNEGEAGHGQLLNYLSEKLEPEELEEVAHHLGMDLAVFDEGEDRRRMRHEAEDRKRADDRRREAEDRHRDESEDQAADRRRRHEAEDKLIMDRRRREAEDTRLLQDAMAKAMDRRRKRRAEDARAALGRDEREDEREEREKREEAQDRKAAMDRRRRREAEDRRRREAEDRRRRDAEDRRRRDAGDGGAHDDPPPFADMPKVERARESVMMDKKAMDMALDAVRREAEAKVASAIVAERQRAEAVRAAENEVRPVVGTLSMAFDSAEEVFKHALKMSGVKIDGVHPSAYRALFDMHRQTVNTRRSTAPTASVAMDSKAEDSFSKMFPGAGRIGAL